MLVSGEDHRHRTHPGFDVIAIVRAIWRRLSRGTREGGSTIEQQIVRVITGRYERTYLRKLREIGLAILVARRYPKSSLPAVYLSIGYYGWRMNGYRQALLRLGILKRQISPEVAAGLVARLKYPQPHASSSRRKGQIEMRTKHLQALYQRHLRDRTYEHLFAPALRNQPEALKAFSHP
jgi:membrane peptidoglycan carboxypeptidase